ncbi:MAG TPA: NUDIX domain-containing protein [Tepidisphaeraceae bacterium]|jgi:ADP-ribose pyrophosphatase YjhB (NUDIX family)|nr:NUDIX domain-containing protein [Tepidisphaeraceae bacterium]
MTSSRHTRISAYAILLKDHSILLCRCTPETDVPGQWTLPGGGIDFGEDPAHAAVREVKEETGFDIALGPLLGIHSRVQHVKDTDHHAIRIIYSAKIIGGVLTPEIGGSTDLCQWILIEQTDTYPLVELAKVGVQLARVEFARA